MNKIIPKNNCVSYISISAFLLNDFSLYVPVLYNFDDLRSSVWNITKVHESFDKFYLGFLKYDLHFSFILQYFRNL